MHSRSVVHFIFMVMSLTVLTTSTAASAPTDTTAPAPVEMDFWEKNPKLWSAVRDQRKILVSAKNEGGQTKSRGAGLVKAEVADVWSFTTNPEKIKNSSRFLKSFTWNKETGAVEMQIELMSISHRLQGIATQTPHAENPKISFQVLEGSLVPFTAELEIRSAKAQAARQTAPTFPEGYTLVRISGVSAQDRALSWPLRVALEAVLQRTAGYLREAVEAEKNSLDKQATAP